MQRLGGVVILMQPDYDGINFLIGKVDYLMDARSIAVDKVFSDGRIAFLDRVSNNIRNHPKSKMYPDVATWAFWCRRANLEIMKKEYNTDKMCLGRGTVFHIAPSNVAVNYAYSFAVSFLAGNISIVRLSSKDFPQVEIINSCIKQALKQYQETLMVYYITNYHFL